MQCKGCEKEITNQEYKQVGKWNFCNACFQSLMEKPPVKVEATTTSHSKVATGIAQCRFCNQTLVSDNYKKLGDWKFCLDCYGKMLPPSTPNFPESEPVATTDEAPPLRTEEIETPGAYSNVRCKGCNKRLVKGASKILGNDHFCPDCFYALNEITVHSQQQNKSLESDGGKSEQIQQCQACLRSLPLTCPIVGGFFICQACISSDKQAAIDIARTRHRQYLRQLQQQLITNEAIDRK